MMTRYEAKQALKAIVENASTKENEKVFGAALYRILDEIEDLMRKLREVEDKVRR